MSITASAVVAGSRSKRWVCSVTASAGRLSSTRLADLTVVPPAPCAVGLLRPAPGRKQGVGKDKRRAVRLPEDLPARLLEESRQANVLRRPVDVLHLAHEVDEVSQVPDSAGADDVVARRLARRREIRDPARDLPVALDELEQPELLYGPKRLLDLVVP